MEILPEPFWQAGVSELTMAAIMNGMALHGGIIPACGTFFVFSDYMKPAVRLAALMEVPVKYVWTHDAFRVGEDGPDSSTGGTRGPNTFVGAVKESSWTK